MSKRQWLVLIVLGAVVIIAVYYSFNPESSSFFPPCPFHYLTGYECPGCGSQRTIHHLLHLRLDRAFATNPLMVLAMPYIGVGVYFEYFGGKEAHPRTRKILFGRNATIIVFVTVILFWLIRNLV